MKGSLRIGTVGGTGLFVHWSFLVLFGWLFAVQASSSGVGAAFLTLLFVAAVFVCVTLHEIGHATMARRFGIRTRDITLLPIGGVARLNRIPEEPRKELLIALAGPVVNVVIAAAIAVGMLVHGASFIPDQAGLSETSFLTTMFWFNVVVVAFNMIPAFPMDGGRVFRAILASGQDYVEATRRAARFGQFIAFGFVVAGLYFNIMLTLVGLFVFFSAAAEAKGVALREIAREAIALDAMTSRFRTLSSQDSLLDAVELLRSGSQSEFPVILEDGQIGILTHGRLLKEIQRRGPSAELGEVIEKPSRGVPADLPLDRAMEKMADEQGPVLVVNALGEVVGILAPGTVQQWLMIETLLKEQRPGKPSRPEFRPEKAERFHVHA